MNGRTEHRIKQVLERTAKLRRKREHHLTLGLSAVSLLLTAALMGAFGLATSGITQAGLPMVEIFGALMLHEGAGSHVFVGALAFAAGAAITVVCFRWHKRH